VESVALAQFCGRRARRSGVRRTEALGVRGLRQRRWPPEVATRSGVGSCRLSHVAFSVRKRDLMAHGPDSAHVEMHSEFRMGYYYLADEHVSNF
jgi:hypothetical protein